MWVPLIACVSVARSLTSGTILAVQTASMVPVFVPGDALIIRASSKIYSVGQVISYRSRKDPRQIVSHRVISVNEKQQQLTTKGDNLAEPDPPIRNWDVLGTVSYIVPKAGYILSFIYTWWGLTCVLYLPALSVLLFEVHRLHSRQNNNYKLGVNRKRVIVTAQ